MCVKLCFKNFFCIQPKAYFSFWETLFIFGLIFKSFRDSILCFANIFVWKNNNISHGIIYQIRVFTTAALTFVCNCIEEISSFFFFKKYLFLNKCKNALHVIRKCIIMFLDVRKYIFPHFFLIKYQLKKLIGNIWFFDWFFVNFKYCHHKQYETILFNN